MVKILSRYLGRKLREVRREMGEGICFLETKEEQMVSLGILDCGLLIADCGTLHELKSLFFGPGGNEWGKGGLRIVDC